MKDLQIFNNPEFGEIRTVDVDGEPWLVGKDVAKALGYKEPAKATREKVEPEDRGVSKIDTPSGQQEMIIINESGLYSLIFSSKLPKAKEFKRWVTSEVLPSIRKTGGYSAHAAPEVSPGGLASLINATRRVMLDMGNSPQDVGAMVQDMLRTWSIPVPPSLSRQIPKQMTFEDYPLLEGRL